MNWIEDPGLESWNQLLFSELDVDEAYVNISSSVGRRLWLYTLSEECVRCPYERRSVIERTVLKFSTKRNLKFRILNDGGAEFVSAANTSSRVCNDIDAHLGEFGVYDLVIAADDPDHITCQLNVAKEPVNIYLPLAALILGLIAITLLTTFATYVTKKVVLRRKKEDSGVRGNYEMSECGGNERANQMSGKPKRGRVSSVDTFRGFCVVIMIFVNDGAGGYWFLEHTAWDGLLLADCVFPWFMWIMGVCIPISIRSQLKRGTSRWRILLNIVKRTVIIFGLGIMLNTVGIGSDLDTIRIPGVLQRFAVVYFITALLGFVFTTRSSPTERTFSVSDIREALKDIIVLLPQWVAVLSIIGIYCYFIFFYRVPGCPSGYLGPGGIQDSKQFFGCVGGMTGYVDRLLIGEKHLYQRSSASEIYKSRPFDPEGILGLLPSIFQVFLGVQAGAILMYHTDYKARLLRWSIWGLVCGVTALVLALPDIIPINKNLWSLSFVLATSSTAFLILAFIFFVQDHLRIWNGAPFKAPGMNPMILYVGHSVAYNMFPFNWKYGQMNTHFMLMFEALWGTALWILVAYWLYFEGFFLSV